MGDRLASLAIDARLRAIGARQLGLVTVAEANAAGIDKHALARRRQSGALVTVFPDVLRLGAVAPSGPQRILAASLQVPGSIVTATSAAVVHADPLPRYLSDERPVLCVGRRQSGRIQEIRVLRPQVPPQNRRWMTWRVTSPTATILQLPRLLNAAAVERCLDHALAHQVSPFYTHGSRQQQERDANRRRLLVRAGWRVLEVTDPDLASELAFASTTSMLRSLLAA